jgi:hypothetical protein
MVRQTKKGGSMFKSLIVDNQKRGSVAVKGGSKGRGDVTNSLGYAVYKVNPTKRKKNKHAQPQAVFLIGINLMKEARLILGDRMDVLYDDESKLGLLKRLPSDSVYGNKLSKAGGKSYCKLHVAGTEAFPLISHIISLENVTIAPDGLLFVWPEDKEKK